MKVMCNKSNTCKWGKQNDCGGTKPHYRGYECGKCHYDKEADCEEIIVSNNTQD
jgi:hypothetical protein